MSDATDAQILSMMHEVLERLQKIEVAQAVLNTQLETHTAADAANFATLNTSIGGLAEGLRELQLARAHDQGVEEGENYKIKPKIKASTIRWAVGALATISAALTAILQYFHIGKS